MIIDAHMHLGEDLIFNTYDSEEDIDRYLQENGVDGVILQPGMACYDWDESCRRIHRYTRQRPGKAWGLLAASPNCSEEEYFEKARWAVEELGFVGLKLHPAAFCCAPTAPQADKIYRAARELNVPVMIHTGNGLPNALPTLAIPAAQKYPDVKFVLAHAGGGMFGGDALVAAQTCPNIYLETSWSFVFDVKSYVEKLGCERLMLGADIPLNMPVELAKYRALKLSDEQYEWCLGRTAQTVFGLK